MKVDDALISKLETLSRLRISAEDRDSIKVELSNMIDLVGKLKEVDTAGVKELQHIHEYKNIVREDSIDGELTHEEAMKNGPEVKKGHFVVPKVING